MTRPAFPSVIDSTIRSAFVTCPRMCELEYIEHWRPKILSVHLHAGGAYASGLEAARESYFALNEPSDLAVAKGLQALLEAYGDFDCPSDSAKSLERMLGALEYYFDQYPMGTEEAKPRQITPERWGIEFSFAEPIDVLHPETGDPLIYCGRMDQVVDFAGGIFGEDDKTASSLGASWSKQWDLRSQFTGYCWGCQQAGIPLQGFLVRGVSILKTKYDTQQALTYRPSWMIERWYKQLCRDIERMKQSWLEGYWDYNLDESCNHYGGCTFRQICLAQNPQSWLETNFERRRWDPLLRKEIKIEG
jgi:hypothetical protein